jgi:hypothetical protein
MDEQFRKRSSEIWSDGGYARVRRSSSGVAVPWVRAVCPMWACFIMLAGEEKGVTEV